jgi:hypothetical protein
MSTLVARDGFVWCLILAGSAWLASPAAAQSAADDPFGEPAASPPTASPATRAGDDPFEAAPAAATAAKAKAAPTLAPAKKAQSDSELEASTRQALISPAQMEFIETPLQDAVDYLKDHHGIEIQLDVKALEDEGIGSDTPVSRTLKGISLASAFRLLLGPLGMTYVVRDGVLLLTTPQAVSRMVELRVYDVGDLAKGDQQENRLLPILWLALSAPQGTHAVARGRSDSSPGATAATVAPPEQASLARDIIGYDNLIVVKASITEHEAIANLLAEMRNKLKAAK